MHRLIIPDGFKGLVPLQGGPGLEPGGQYICSNAFAGRLMQSRYPIEINGQIWSLRTLIQAVPFEFEPFDPTKDWNDKDIWLGRAGGWGDLLLLTPLIRELKKRWPKSRISVACGNQFHPLFDGIDVICRNIPIRLEDTALIDGYLNFEEIIEGKPAGRTMHMAQLFASEAGIELSNLKPDYILKPEEQKWAWNAYPRSKLHPAVPTSAREFVRLPRIGIQLLASAFYRTYPQMAKVMGELAKSAQVFLLGAPGQIILEKPVKNIINLMDHNLTFRESVAVLSTCDVCLSPDSAMVHVSSALNIPCVALYGPFPSKHRITSSLAHVLEGKAPCAPCFFHAEAPDEFPYGMPCFEKKMCVALESISQEEVVRTVLSLIHLPQQALRILEDPVPNLAPAAP